MPRLFCDVDGTLAFGERTNAPLVRAIQDFLDAHDGWDLVVWSHAGIEHAKSWARRCFILAGYHATVEEKDFRKLQPGDVCIDNMHLPFGVLPTQFVRDVEDGREPPPPVAVGLPRGPAGHVDLAYWNRVMNR